MLPKFTYVRPTTVNEALAVLNDRPALIHGGGTDLIGLPPRRRLQRRHPGLVVRHRRAQGHPAGKDGGLRIGALTTIAEIADRQQGRGAGYTALADAARGRASPQLRNQGTIAGNLCQKPRCWYYRGDFDCLRKGGDNVLRLRGREPVPLHLRWRYVLHRPPVGHRAGAGRARRRLPDLRARPRAARLRSSPSTCRRPRTRSVRRCSSPTRSSPRSSCRRPPRAPLVLPQGADSRRLGLRPRRRRPRPRLSTVTRSFRQGSSSPAPRRYRGGRRRSRRRSSERLSMPPRSTGRRRDRRRRRAARAQRLQGRRSSRV